MKFNFYRLASKYNDYKALKKGRLGKRLVTKQKIKWARKLFKW